jgi:hypothetical protein
MGEQPETMCTEGRPIKENIKLLPSVTPLYILLEEMYKTRVTTYPSQEKGVFPTYCP